MNDNLTIAIYWKEITIVIETISIIAMSVYFKYYLTSYLKEKGKNLATKQDIQEITNKVETVKQEYKKEFDLIQKQNDAHFSELKNTKDRYNSKQFEIYNNLWSSLIELKFSGDNLWDEATKTRLRIFSKKVAEAKKSIEASSLLLEDSDYSQLIELLSQFNNFQVGKAKLISTKNKSDTQMNDYRINEQSINEMIRENGKIKESYDTLITQLKEKFKSQIQGNRNSGTN